MTLIKLLNTYLATKFKKAYLSQNGDKAALVDVESDCVGIICPLKNVNDAIITKPKFLFDEPKESVKEAA